MTVSYPTEVADYRAELASLTAQTIAARAELARTREDLEEARARLGSHDMQLLLEANEQLTLELARSRRLADSTALRLTELTRTSELDALTSLPNRLLLIDRFTQGLTLAKRHKGRLALLFLDLDGFKVINDTLGHKMGDDVLRAVSLSLVGCVRQIDTVCRLGGDEFVVLLPEISDASDPSVVAEKLMASLSHLRVVQGRPVQVCASIGISVYPDDADDIEQLVDCADQAMYLSKRSGGCRYTFFSEPSSERGLPIFLVAEYR